MIHFELLQDQKILSVTPEGPLQSEDFKILADAMDPLIEAGGDLKGLIIDAPIFSGWESFADLVSHMKYVKNHERHIQKIAVVTDSGFLSVMPRIVSHFVKADVRHFAGDEKSQAMFWLSED